MAETPFQPGSGAADAASTSDPGSLGITDPTPEAATQEAPLVPEEPAAELPAPEDQPPTIVAPEPPASPEPEPAAEPPAADVQPSMAPATPEPEPAMAADPVPEPTQASPASAPTDPASEPLPAAEVQPPGVAATIEVPPLEGASAEEGGEWELLLNRVTGWWTSGELGRQWQRIRGPLKGVAILVAVLVALRLYATAVSTIESIPLVSGLLELAGLITVLQFGATRLVRSSDRQDVLAQWRRLWLDFRGRD